ncbi:hypothetical protein KSF78_0007758 [Schistosoma japonicum]|nr:hypothetical protein KSF78_0007758 [Schistosoma japonicum]
MEVRNNLFNIEFIRVDLIVHMRHLHKTFCFEMISSSLIVNLEEVNEFERNLKTANNNTQQLIKAVSEFKGSLETTNENIRRLISGVNVFERSLETIDENIRLLINFNNLQELLKRKEETIMILDYFKCKIYDALYHN